MAEKSCEFGLKLSEEIIAHVVERSKFILVCVGTEKYCSLIIIILSSLK